MSVDRVLALLGEEGCLPYMARVRDHLPEDRVYPDDDPGWASFREAEADADRRNREFAERLVAAAAQPEAPDPAPIRVRRTARDVLRYIDAVERTGDPPPHLVATVEHLIRDPVDHYVEAGPPWDGRGNRRPVFLRPVTYEAIAKRVGWHRGGAGDLLAKAIASVDHPAVPSRI